MRNTLESPSRSLDSVVRSASAQTACFDTVAMAAMRDKRGSVFECVSVHKSVLSFSLISNASLSHVRVCTSFSLVFERMIYHNIHHLLTLEPFYWSQRRCLAENVHSFFFSLTKPLYDFRSHIDTLMGLFIVQTQHLLPLKQSHSSLEWVLNKWCPIIDSVYWILNNLNESLIDCSLYTFIFSDYYI